LSFSLRWQATVRSCGLQRRVVRAWIDLYRTDFCMRGSISLPPPSAVLLGLTFNPGDGGITFLCNDGLSPNYTALQYYIA
jgi:hypothetical protein